MPTQLWQICDIIGLIFIAANGQILKNNPTIWLHWLGYVFYIRFNVPRLGDHIADFVKCRYTLLPTTAQFSLPLS